MAGRFGKRTPATYALVVSILIGTAAQMFGGAWSDPSGLAKLGANLPWFYVHATGEYWRFLTAMFLHSGFLHLGMNLLALYQLGTLYEVMFGARRFLFIYFVAGIAASITSTLHIDGMSVGASGAIFGILGAFIFSILRSPIWRHERGARGLVVQCLIWIAANVLIGLQIERIDVAAHIGGLVTGLVLGAILPQPKLPPPPPTSVIDVTPYEG